MIKPRALRPGDRIAAISLSSGWPFPETYRDGNSQHMMWISWDGNLGAVTIRCSSGDRTVSHLKVIHLDVTAVCFTVPPAEAVAQNKEESSGPR